MWWHADNSTYGLLLQGLATADDIAGPYTFQNATAPLGNWSQDFGIFTDYKDGRSYALYSNGDRKEGRDVYLTSFDEEVGALDEVVHRFDKYDLDHYYLNKYYPYEYNLLDYNLNKHVSVEYLDFDFDYLQLLDHREWQPCLVGAYFANGYLLRNILFHNISIHFHNTSVHFI